MLNQITIMGRFTKDPELRYTTTQKPVASFTLAVDRDYNGKEGGERQTDFIPCTAWNSTAEFVNKYFRKGNLAVVNGRLQIREWADKEGGKHRTAEIVAENIYFCEKKGSTGGETPAGGKQAGNNTASTGRNGGFTPAPEDDEGELPF